MRTRQETIALERSNSQIAGTERHQIHDLQHGCTAQARAGEILAREESRLSRSSESALLRLQQRHGNRYVQRLVAARSGENEVTSDVESAIDRARSGGQALDHSVRSQMEGAFGADFAAVRVHTGPDAHALNHAVNAVAFTTGPDIFFRDGSYNPSNSGGKELLAHELTHVVQQGGASMDAHIDSQRSPVQRMCPACAEEEKKGPLQYKLDVSQPGDPYELEADRTAAAVMKTLATASPKATAGSEPAATEEEEKAAK